MRMRQTLAASWLLEMENPAVAHRALTELLNSGDREALLGTREALRLFLPQLKNAAWQSQTKGLWLTYHLTALAECGLTREQTDVETAADRYLLEGFDAGCGDAMGLRALVMLGFGEDGRVRERLAHLTDAQLPDGGFLCLHRLGKMDRTPKSCYKDNALMLMLFAECKKRGLPLPGGQRLVRYFLERGLFYRRDDKSLVLNSRAGWRSVDTFYPFEVMRVGLQNIAEALSALGYGEAAEMKEAWQLLEGKKDEQGKYLLEGTLTKSYLPKERVGKPSKWVTLYALLAEKHRRQGAK